MKNILILFVFLFFKFFSYSQTAIIDSLFFNSYKVFEMQRLPNGMYRDSKLFSGIDYHPISIANTGMGLVSICIADSMNWINDGEAQVIQTLKTLNGYTPGFIPDRNSNGYFRHFIDVNTGNQVWSSEYSTIDTDILISGVLFCMKYFQNSEITQYALELWNSIDFDAAIANPATGQIYLSMNQDGTGDIASLTSPYNEYMIVAWLAKNYSNNSSSPGNILWNNFYNFNTSLPHINYNGFNVLSDNNSSFLSSFTHQFNYYLCHYFTTSNDYLLYFENSQKADSSWCSSNTTNSYEWGLGAGSAISTSYHADGINNNPDLIISPHIIAGYIPVNQEGKQDLINLWQNNLGKYSLPNSTSDKILWRYSIQDTNWMPNEVIGIDYSTMLFGLSTLPEYLGLNFFKTYNDFFPLSDLNINTSLKTLNIEVFPNPFFDYIDFQFNQIYSSISISIKDITGKIVVDKYYNNIDKIHLPIELIQGVYVIMIDNGSDIRQIKVVKQ